MKTLTDQLGTIHTFENTPKLIVSLVPSQTELLYDLGLEDSIVGITKFCIHPEHLKSSKTIAGGTKEVDLDKIRALQPDIIICNKEENTQEMVVALRQICPVWVTDIYSIEDNFQMITDFGQLFDCVSKAQDWIAKITDAWNDFKVFVKNKPIYKVSYFIWRKPYMVAGANNFINELLKQNHYGNIYDADLGRYPVIDLEDLASRNPDIILLSSEPYPFKEKHVLEIQQSVPSAKIILVDGEMFSWYGSRLLRAFEYFKKTHHKIGLLFFT